MSDTYDPNQPPQRPSPEPGGFCQQCGRPLTAETMRRVGNAVFCEPCLAARLGEMPGPGAGGTYAGGQPFSAAGYTSPGNPPTGSQAWAAQQLAGSRPNPGLAALLGLIPGVGAMYNEQYAKGLVHLIVFAVLTSLADHVNGIFGVFVAGWIFYMAIEAHHTARARRDGTPLPNPFGLNDIGERFGFGRAWPAGPSVAQVAYDAAQAAAAAASQATATYATPAGAQPQPFASQPFPGQPFPGQPFQPPYGPPQPQTPGATAGWGAPPETFGSTAAAPPQEPLQGGHASPFGGPVYATGSPFTPPGTHAPYTEVPYGSMPQAEGLPFLPSRSNRFPAGAVWLIGLGSICLLATTGIFNGFEPEVLIGLITLGLGVWSFVRRMLDSGETITDDDSPGYRLRLLRALRFSVWLVALGICFLLDAFNLVAWRHSWPFFIILAGLMSILERAVTQSAYATFIQTGPPVAQPAPAPAGDQTPGGN